MEQWDLLRRVVETLDAMGVRYMVVGSYGSSAWGEPRYTYDIDVVVAAEDLDVQRFVARFPAEEFYVSPEAMREAIGMRGQFNVIHPASGHKVDFMIQGRDAWGASQLLRRRKIELNPGLSAYVAAPEDIIISKMLYYKEGGSEKHLRDITGMLRISGPEIDESYVRRWATELDLMEIWEAVLARLGRGG